MSGQDRKKLVLDRLEQLITALGDVRLGDFDYGEGCHTARASLELLARAERLHLDLSSELQEQGRTVALRKLAEHSFS